MNHSADMPQWCCTSVIPQECYISGVLYLESYIVLPRMLCLCSSSISCGKPVKIDFSQFAPIALSGQRRSEGKHWSQSKVGCCSHRINSVPHRIDSVLKDSLLKDSVLKDSVLNESVLKESG